MTQTDNAVDLTTIDPMQRAEGIDLGREAYRRLIAELRSLEPDDWVRQTDCDLWTVRDLAGHVAGMMWSMATLRRTTAEQARAGLNARREGIDPVDAMTAIQVDRMRGLSADELVTRMDELVDPVLAGRARLPLALARRAKLTVNVGGTPERWSLAFLTGPILTRDTWLHRVADLSRALARAPHLDDHDARIVADAAAEWARAHGQPVELTVTGPAGGRFHQGDGGPLISVDAVEFARMTSGRAEPTHPLLATQIGW